MGGITALKNGSCHLSGMHLFDPGSDDFNFPFIKKFLPDVDVTVINLAIRHQGIIVPHGNPMNIQGIDDFTRVRFINRQRGAGTRILLDWKLKQAGLKPSDVKGYDKEEFTHMAVAVNVLTGAADCGMGIYAADVYKRQAPRWKRKAKSSRTASPPCRGSRPCSPTAGAASWPGRRGIR